MSWLKRRGQGTSPNPPSAPPVHMYNPNQHSSSQRQWQQQDLQAPPNSWYTQPQETQQNVNPTNYSQPPQEHNYWSNSYNKQTSNRYSPNTSSQYNEQYPPHNSAVYTNQNNSYQHKNYNNQPAPHPTYHYSEPSKQVEAESNADSWNWGWGDEDNSNVQNVPQSQTNSNVNTNVPLSSTETTRNWTVDDNNAISGSKNITDTSSTTQFNPIPQNLQNVGPQSSFFPQMGKLADKPSQDTNKYSEDHILEQNINRSSPYIDSLNQAVMTPTLKHNKTDHLTPQWSTESQMSQDSSDILHTSESDKSHMLSRSSTISESPVSGHDVNSENVMLRQEIPNTQQHELYNTQTFTETSVADNISSNFFQQDTYSMQQENKEDISAIREDLIQFKTNSTPPPPPPLLKNQTPPLGAPMGDQNLNNPYKLNLGLSHRSANKYNTETKPPVHYSLNQSKYPMTQSPFNQSVNLESLPDNSEQPDTVPHAYKKPSPLQQWPENNEVAPINDRNQYLETGQLSNNEFNQSPTNTLNDTSDALPPPGFTRMVLGQMGQADNLGNQDEPPPGLSRMVLGETGSSSSVSKTDYSEPLHRMIPGGSSSPKPLSRYQTTTYQSPTYGDGDISESELNAAPIPNQIRSVTIGADISPVGTNLVVGSSVVNRSKTIGADITLPYSSTNPENVKSSASNNFNNNIRETNVDGANNLDETISQPVTTRRDSIEGEPQDTSLSNLVNAMREISVGENSNNGANSTLAVTERPPRRASKQESTDSDCEHESGHMSRDRRDRRYYDKHNDYDRDKARSSRYTPSPDRYRDKKYERMRYRDRRYNDDTDYYSDKEKNRSRDDKGRQEELDRKYSSLKRDKDKERRRKEPRSQQDYGREGHRKEYYHRYEDEYDDPSRSRPSSRSDSLHDSYRQDRNRHRDRERDRYRRHRDPYMPYVQQGYSYDPYNPYYQQYQYQYLENLRRTNPQAYAEWYRKYYQQQGNSQQAYGNEDRASVHSGRSSANDELNKDRPFDQTDSSLYLEETASHRLTPAKFATAHIKASIASGRLVKIFPHYPLDGQPAIVEVGKLKDVLSNDDGYKELDEFPGPLIKGVTHKKTIIEYCENKIRNAIYSSEIIDVDSYILMWELLILLLRQNGMVVGTDIAELLMKDRKQENSRKASVTSNNSSGVMEATTDASHLHTSDVTSSSTSILKEEVVTSKFRDYLLYGSEKEALEWAMKHGLWGHALFLASKLDKRTYANVMTRFANGLTMNDPLQTLYQLLSGKLPASVTCVSDEKWGDWRPHLAMILSNTTQRPELDRKAITTLGDTLLNRNSLYAAQFCYLMAQVGFSRYGVETAKLVLLGSNHNKPFMEFAINEAIYMTEVYEYACSLNDVSFVIPEFLPYKYLLATRLADRGLLEKSLAYLEKIALAVLQNPAVAQPTLIHQVSVLADRLKYCDPVEDSFEGDVELDDNRPDNSWLKELKAIEKDYNMVLSVQETIENLGSNVEIDQNPASQTVYEQPTWSQQYTDEKQYQNQWQTMQHDPHNNLNYQQMQQNPNIEGYSTEQYQDQQPYWSNQQLVESVEQIGVEATSQPPHTNELQSQNNYWNSAPAQPEDVENQPEEVSKAEIDAFIPLQIDGTPQHTQTNTAFIKKLTTSDSCNVSENDSLFTSNLLPTDSTRSSYESDTKNYKPYPFKNRSAEEFSSINKTHNLNRKSASVDSGDYEVESNSVRRRQNNGAVKSHLIKFKDHTKVVALKSDTKVTKYNTFDLKSADKRNKMMKYKSLDEPISKTLIKYQDTQVRYQDARSNVSISTQDFDLSFKFSKFDRKPKRDLITNTVDSWAKKSTKTMLSNIKNSLFKHSSSDKAITFKPLVFGGTFPIDAPTSSSVVLKDVKQKEYVEAYGSKPNWSAKTDNFKLLFKDVPQIRKYGTPKTFDIDRPI